MKKLSREKLEERLIALLTEGFVMSYGEKLVECLFYDNTTKKYYHIENDISKDTETKKGYERDEFTRFISQNWNDEFGYFITQVQEKIDLS